MSTAVLQESNTSASAGDERLDVHVALLTNYIPPYALPVYAELSRRVRKLTILLSTPMESNRPWKADWGTLDVKVQRTLTLQRPWRHPTGFSEPASIHLPWDTMGALRRLRPDVVLTTQMGVRSLLSACYATLSRKPLVTYVNLSEHQERGAGWIRRLLRRFLISRTTSLAVNGQSGARYLRTLGARDERLFLVPYVALPTLFGYLPLTRSPMDAHKLFYAGQFVTRKGLLPFIEALSRWAEAHPTRYVEFELAGSGPLEGELRALKLPQNLRLKFLGQRTFAELSEHYSRAGILAFPTLSDEWGLIVNEALAAGVPVLGSVYSQAVEELCIEGETGWRFRPDAAGEMEQAIDRALSTSPEQLDTMRRTGHDLVKHLTPEFAADRFVETIKAAMPTGRGRETCP